MDTDETNSLNDVCPREWDNLRIKWDDKSNNVIAPRRARRNSMQSVKNKSDVGKCESALETQVGGGHYKDLAIQPMEYSMKNNLDACQHTVIKYVTRFRDKGGVEDLKKAKHCIDMLIEFESV